jgi:hypothetical protein
VWISTASRICLPIVPSHTNLPLLLALALPTLVMRLLSPLGQESLLLASKGDIATPTVRSSVNSAVKATNDRFGVVRVNIKVLDVPGKIVAFSRASDASVGLALAEIELNQGDAALIAGLEDRLIIWGGVGVGEAGDDSKDGNDGGEVHFDQELKRDCIVFLRC